MTERRPDHLTGLFSHQEEPFAIRVTQRSPVPHRHLITTLGPGREHTPVVLEAIELIDELEDPGEVVRRRRAHVDLTHGGRASRRRSARCRRTASGPPRRAVVGPPSTTRGRCDRRTSPTPVPVARAGPAPRSCERPIPRSMTRAPRSPRGPARIRTNALSPRAPPGRRYAGRRPTPGRG